MTQHHDQQGGAAAERQAAGARDPRAVPQYPDLAGRLALVTGGSRGIGAAACRALAANGVRVVVNARTRPDIDRLVDELRSQGAEAVGVSGDVSKADQVETLRRRIEEEHGDVDIVLAFAGGFAAYTPLVEIKEDEWHGVVDANLTSTFLTLRAFLPRMIERRAGAFVTMASNAGRYLDITLTASYAAAKAGIVMLTRHVAREVGPYGVRVNCVAPATTLTERVAAIMHEEQRRSVAAMAPLGRLGHPDDTAYAALYLVSDSAGWITGVTLDVAGGRIML